MRTAILRDLEHRDLTSLQQRVSVYEVEAPSRGHLLYCEPLLLLSSSVSLSGVVVVVAFLDILVVPVVLVVLVVAHIVDGWRTKNQEKH